jgi:hypothetical protein
MDILGIKEAFADCFYTRFGYAVEPGWTVVDIGAAIGEFTVLAAGCGRGGLVENLRLNQSRASF